VLLEEVLTAFAVAKADGTWMRRSGPRRPSAAILERVGPRRVFAIDRDPQAAEARPARFGANDILVSCAR